MMTPVQRRVFEFAYRRRGMTTLWNLDKRPSSREIRDGEVWDGPGARRVEHDEKFVWFEVMLEISEEDDIEDRWTDAEILVHGKFREHYPDNWIADA
jgi:hypothetical protein